MRLRAISPTMTPDGLVPPGSSFDATAADVVLLVRMGVAKLAEPEAASMLSPTPDAPAQEGADLEIAPVPPPNPDAPAQEGAEIQAGAPVPPAPTPEPGVAASKAATPAKAKAKAAAKAKP
ncbi:hypothetical protein C8P66_108131 [Humitalea rosea]|uniref:Uncharacterized protein n=1 Tax=Humitalea rosea TaxID=990373 RepID=A0A2W7J6L6_9PROT|nr:hypothetical protein [Humitalea rosea]PZW46852.1 hypothetical protein C8P66_108131 [Humitalea rosea]